MHGFQQESETTHDLLTTGIKNFERELLCLPNVSDA